MLNVNRALSEGMRQTRMRVLHVVAETPLSFLQHLKDITYIERRPLRYVLLGLSSGCYPNDGRPGFVPSAYNRWSEHWSLTA